MPADSGRYPLASPRALQDSTGGYIGVVAQGPAPGDTARPLHPKDWNDAQHALLNFSRSLGLGLGTGAADESGALLRPLAVSANIPSFQGAVASGLDAASFYMVGGIPVYMGGVATLAWDSTSDATVNLLHRKATDLTAQSVTDTTLNLPTDALVGYDISLRKNDGTWTTPSVITGNTASVINFTDAVTLGTAPSSVPDPSVIAAGVPQGVPAYRLDLTTPGASRDNSVDTVWLDVWVEEIAAAATASDPFVDATLNLNIQGTVMETTRRWQVRRAVFVDQDNSALTAAGVVATAGAFTEVGDNLYTYTDVSGIKHYCTSIAQYQRFNGAADVEAQYVKDLRNFAGQADKYKREEVAGAAVGYGVVSGLAPSRTDTNYVVASGVVTIDGIHRNVTGVTLTGPTDGAGGAWSGATTYYGYVDQDARVRVVASPSAPGATDIPLDKFTVAGGVMPSFAAEGSAYENQRRYVISSAELFQPDVNGKIRRDLDLLGNASGGGTIQFYNRAGVSQSFMNVFGDDFRVKTDLASARLAAGNNANTALMVASADATKTLHLQAGASASDGILDAYTDAAVTGSYAPGTAKFKATQHNSVRSPGVTFGTPAAAAPITGYKYIVPASEGAISCDSSSNPLPFIHRADWVHINTATLPAAYKDATAADQAKAFFCLPLRVPRGMTVTNIKLHYSFGIGAGSDIRIYTRLMYRDVFPGVLSQYVIDIFGDTGVLTSASSTPKVVSMYEFADPLPPSPVPFTQLSPSTRGRVYLVSWVTSTTGTGALVDFHGAEVQVTMYGTGNYDVLSSLTMPLEGLLA